MCGLTGFARHPNAPDLGRAVGAFHDLMGAMPHRGRHATGLAVINPTAPFLWKKALPVDVVQKTPAWMKALDAIREDATVVMGHVRYATHANADQDAAAHPFHIGHVVGAHNGIISNWEDVLMDNGYNPHDFRVDSEAVFAALDKATDPATALKQLKGYFALTWTKRTRFYLVRSQSAPLACAYVPTMQTLFWHSETKILERVLNKLNMDMDMWELKPSTVYRYTPREFDRHGTNAVKRVVELQATKKKVNTAKPTHQWALDEKPRKPVRNYGGEWDSVTAKETPRSLTYSLKDMSEVLERLEGRVEALEAENEHLYGVLNAHGLVDSAPDLLPAPDPAQMDMLPEWVKDRSVAH